MILSKYNTIYYSKNNGYLLYNSLSNSFAKLNKELYNILLEIKTKPELVEKIDKDLFKILLEKKIFVESDIDEYDNIKLKTLMNRYDSKVLSLTIAPTRDCNFNCTYCYEEDRPPIYIDNITCENIVKFIESYKDVKYLSLCWYGGEPLLAFDRIEEITNILKEKDYIINATLISNGYLLTDHIVDKLNNLFIHSIQITIDGLEDTHNVRRKHKVNKDSFNKIINNIELVVSKHENIIVAIRCNIDKSNSAEYHKLQAFINSRFKKYNNIHLSPGFVEEGMKCCFNRKERTDFLLEQFYKYNNTELSFYPSGFRSECMARCINSFLIDPEGNLFKCWADICQHEKSIGNINTKEFNSVIATRYLVGADQLEDKKCIECNLFPICDGGCAYQRIENKFNKTEHDLCDLRRGNLHKFLDIHYEIKNRMK